MAIDDRRFTFTVKKGSDLLQRVPESSGHSARFSTLKPIDYPTPYEQMLSNSVQFSAMDKRHGAFFSIMVRLCLLHFALLKGSEGCYCVVLVFHIGGEGLRAGAMDGVMGGVMGGVMDGGGHVRLQHVIDGRMLDVFLANCCHWWDAELLACPL